MSGYRIRSPVCCNEICDNLSNWVVFVSLVAIVGFFAASLDINTGTNTEIECIQTIMPYNLASLVVNSFLVLGICVFTLISNQTNGKFDIGNQSNTIDFCCCSYRFCATVIWLIILAGSLSLAIVGTKTALISWNCLPKSFKFLTVFSLGYQYLAILASFFGVLFRSGCLVYVENEGDSTSWIDRDIDSLRSRA